MSTSLEASLRVLRICSVFEPPAHLHLDRVAGFDPIGGMQNHTAELTRNLDALGVGQTVVTTRPPGAPARQVVGASAQVLRLGWPIRRLRQLYSVPALPHVLRAAPAADVVHVHLGEDLAVIPLGLAAAARGGVPVVLTVHCSLRHTFEGPGLRGLAMKSIGAALEGVGQRRASAVIVLTEQMARAVARDVPAGRLHVIPPGVNPDLFRGPFEDPLPGVPRPRVLFVGRLAPQKGVFHLVRAIPRIASQAHVVLVGDGPERSAVESLAANLGVRDRLVVTGFVHHDRVPQFLAHADVLVLPSMYEELGTILLEGMRAGLPLVASRAGGIPAVIRDGDNGLLCPPGDPDALASTIERVLADPRLRASLSERARIAGERYDWRAVARRVLEIYEAVTGRAPASPEPAGT